MVFYKSSREHFGGLAQLGERLPCKQEVTSSTLVFSIFEWKIIKKDSFLWGIKADPFCLTCERTVRGMKNSVQL